MLYFKAIQHNSDGAITKLPNTAQEGYTEPQLPVVPSCAFSDRTVSTDAAAIRSMYEVALACVNDANASAEAKAYCQTIVDSVTNAAN